jgi:two-component system NarL family sensor kinase
VILVSGRPIRVYGVPVIERHSPAAIDEGALLRGALQVLELIATGAPLRETLDELCRTIDALCGRISMVYLLSPDEDRMSFAAGPKVPAPFREGLRSFVPTPTTTGACGAAVHRREAVIVPDTLTSPLYEQWRAVIRASGIRSVWSTPFCAEDGRVLGTFALADTEPGVPSECFRVLVTRATHLASIAVERHRTDARLRESEIRFSRAFYANPTAMTIAGFADGRFRYVNDAFVSMFGHSRTEALGQTALGLGLYANPADRASVLDRLMNRDALELDVKGRTKSGRTLDLVLSAQRIELLGEEMVLGITTDVTDRNRAQENLRHSEELLRLVLNAIPVGVAVVDPAGDVILCNPAVERIWGGPVVSSGPERYRLSKGWWHDTGRQIEPDEWASVRARRDGETSLNEVIDIEAFDGVRKIIHNSSVPIRDVNHAIVGAVIVNEDVTHRKMAERDLEVSMKQMQVLATRLMHAQDDERRRIAQMLHETTAQDLAALKMMLARVQRTSKHLSESERAVLDEAARLAEHSMSDVRTLSYLLHPPFLDENGLLSAIRWYAEGFTRRSGIQIDLDLPPSIERLPQVVETTLFRIIQEALINIHRHANSTTARIVVRPTDDRLVLEIQDRGTGMSADFLARLVDGSGALGVGIAGMRERLKQLGSRLEIDSDDRGTTVRAVVPLPAAAP